MKPHQQSPGYDEGGMADNADWIHKIQRRASPVISCNGCSCGLADPKALEQVRGVGGGV